MSSTKYSKYLDATNFEDHEAGRPICNDCGSREIDIWNHQCDNCGSPDISRDTVLENKSCAICGDEFEAFDSNAMFSESEQRFICTSCYEEFVEPQSE